MSNLLRLLDNDPSRLDEIRLAKGKASTSLSKGRKVAARRKAAPKKRAKKAPARKATARKKRASG